MATKRSKCKSCGNIRKLGKGRCKRCRREKVWETE